MTSSMSPRNGWSSSAGSSWTGTWIGATGSGIWSESPTTGITSVIGSSMSSSLTHEGVGAFLVRSSQALSSPSSHSWASPKTRDADDPEPGRSNTHGWRSEGPVSSAPCPVRSPASIDGSKSSPWVSQSEPSSRQVGAGSDANGSPSSASPSRRQDRRHLPGRRLGPMRERRHVGLRDRRGRLVLALVVVPARQVEAGRVFLLGAHGGGPARGLGPHDPDSPAPIPGVLQALSLVVARHGSPSDLQELVLFMA